MTVAGSGPQLPPAHSVLEIESRGFGPGGLAFRRTLHHCVATLRPRVCLVPSRTQSETETAHDAVCAPPPARAAGLSVPAGRPPALLPGARLSPAPRPAADTQGPGLRIRQRLSETTKHKQIAMSCDPSEDTRMVTSSLAGFGEPRGRDHARRRL